MRRSVRLLSVHHALNQPRKHLSHIEAPANISRNYRIAISSSISQQIELDFKKRHFCLFEEQVCWNCNRERRDKYLCQCEFCGSLQNAPKDINYFKLLKLEDNYNVDSAQLTRNFRQLQSIVHPDKFSNRTEKDQRNSLEWSSLINKAYKTIVDPIERGEHILGMEGLSLPEDNSALDKEFLMEVMERSEEVEEAESNDILNLLEKVQKDLEDSSVDLKEAFAGTDFEKAKFILVKMKYFRSLQKMIKEKAVKLGVTS